VVAVDETVDRGVDFCLRHLLGLHVSVLVLGPLVLKHSQGLDVSLVDELLADCGLYGLVYCFVRILLFLDQRLGRLAVVGIVGVTRNILINIGGTRRIDVIIIYITFRFVVRITVRIYVLT